MADLVNCSNCGDLMIKNKFRDICDTCYREEEKTFDEVYKFIRKGENRTATIPQVMEATGVPEHLLMKFIRDGRLLLTQFPNLGYPCEKCGSIIRSGKLCGSCIEGLKKDLTIHEKEKEMEEEIEQRNRGTYLSRS